MTEKIREGYMSWEQYQTYYRIVGEPTENPPLLLLHGGPGSTHNYFELLDRLAEDSGRQIIMYDQLGCGNSYIDGHPELWRMETWMRELRELRSFLHLERVHILGQSWGGMLLLQYLVSEKPEGVVSAVLSSTLPSSKLWGQEQHRMIRYLPENEQEAIRLAEERNDYSDPAYLRANEHYMEQHCAGPYTEKDPECLTRPKRSGTEAYLTAWGPNEYTPTGTLRDYDVTEQLQEITVPCLILSGTDDLCTPYIAKTMYDRIPDASWHLFREARHMCYADANAEYCQVLTEWLGKKRV